MRYAIVLAEELHFGRAAARLYLAQQALSRQIKQLEQEVGVQLFERTTRTVALTPAGAVFVERAREAIAAFESSVEAARREVTPPSGLLRMGYIPGAALELTPLILAEFQTRNPHVTVETREFGAADPSAGLISGESDIAIIRLPQSTHELATEALFSECVVAMMSVDHHLASRPSLNSRDLLDEPITLSNTDDPTYRAFWSLENARGGRPANLIPISSITEEIQVVSQRSAVSLVPAAASRFVPAPGLRFVPVTDWPRSTVAIAWQAADRSSIVQAFAEASRSTCRRELALVQMIESGAPTDSRTSP